MRKALFPLIAFLVLSGCVVNGEVPGEFVPLPQRDDGRENITVTRDSKFFGAGDSLWLTVDGRDVGKLRGKKVVSFGLESGHHTVGVRCGPNIQDIVRDWYHATVEFEISGEVKMLQFRVGMSGFERLTQAYDKTTPVGPCYIHQDSQ